MSITTTSIIVNRGETEGTHDIKNSPTKPLVDELSFTLDSETIASKDGHMQKEITERSNDWELRLLTANFPAKNFNA